jgi:hypothetical protein
MIPVVVVGGTLADGDDDPTLDMNGRRPDLALHHHPGRPMRRHHSNLLLAAKAPKVG